MPLKKSKRLPKKYARPVTKKTRKLVEKRYERSKQFKKDKLRRIIRRGEQITARWKRSAIQWLAVFAVGVALLAIGLLLFSPLLQIREITVQRFNPRLDAEAVQQVLAPLFSRHLFFVQGREVEALLHKNISDVHDVRVSKKYPSTLSVAIELDPLVARLQIVDPDEEENTGTGATVDFLTDQGVYIHTVVQEADILPFVRLVDWGVRPIPGDRLVDPQMLKSLWEVETALRQQFGHDITIRSIYLRAQEYHVLADGISLWFDMRSTLEEHIQRYRTFLQHVPREEVQQYIDLRLMDRVVYK